MLPVQVKNAGTTPITFTSVAATSDYTLAGTCPSAGATLAVNASCIEQVTFTPTAIGVRNGVLSFTTSASTQPLTVALSGTGTMAKLVVSPALLSFGNVAIGAFIEPSAYVDEQRHSGAKCDRNDNER